MAAEGLILDSLGGSPLNLGNMGSLRLSAFEPGFAARRSEWVQNADSDAAKLVRDPYYDNATGSFTVRVFAASMDAAMSAVGALELKLAECSKFDGGLPFLWTPASATTGLTGYLLVAEITARPVTYADGWFAGSPLITVSFTRKPFLYGTEVTGPTATSTAPVATVEVPSVPGDVSAEARLVITDLATQNRSWVEWGLESLNYSHSSPSSVLIDSEDLITTGFSGAQATRTGGYRRAGATHDTVSATLIGTGVAVCGTGVLPHVGTWRVKARIWAASTNQYWRLAWQSGDGGWVVNQYVQPVAAASFNEIDLGTIVIPAAEAGNQKWSGRIEAYSAISGTELGEVDYLILYPVSEGYGRIEAPVSGLATTLSAYDNFDTGQTLGTVLAGRTAVIGGTWATSGATTDFAAGAEANSTFSEDRSTALVEATPRFAILGSTTFTDSSIAIAHFVSNSSAHKLLFAILRYVDANNYAFARMETSGVWTFAIGVVVASVQILLATTKLGIQWGNMTLQAQSNGALSGWLSDPAGNPQTVLSGTHAALAGGGALASGKPGFADQSLDSIACKRARDNVYVSTLSPLQAAVNSGRALEIRSDANLRQSADGLSYGDIPSRGSRLLIPNTGDPGRYTRIVARAARNDLMTAADTPLGDNLGLAVFYTPRFLAVPRS